MRLVHHPPRPPVQAPGGGRAELHLHFEGSIGVETAVALSRRYGGPFPNVPAFLARRRPGSPQGFFRLYRDVCRLLRAPEDYARIARDLVRRLRREGIRHAEVYVSPAVVERMGLPWLAVRDAVEEVFASHERAGHGRVLVLLDSVRQWGPAAAARVLDLHAASPWPRAVGFGLGGEETSVPARDFAPVYARLEPLGLAPLVHAGEWAGPEHVVEALEHLRPIRIAHGFRSAESPALVRLLARRGVVLDLCLASNEATGALRPGQTHPALTLLRAGVTVTLSTDDPGLFGATLAGEFRRLARLGATGGELDAVRRAAFSAALLGHFPHRHQGSPARTLS